MPALVATVGASNAFHVGLVLTAFGFGFRHGIDWDHIAALTDITSSQEEPRRSMWFATLYALGHALVVLGCYVFYALARHGRDFRMRSRWMLMLSGVRRGVHWLRRREGATSELVEIEHDHVHPLTDPHDVAHEHVHGRTREDADVLVGAVSGNTALPDHRHRHRHVVPLPDDPFANYGPRTAFG